MMLRKRNRPAQKDQSKGQLMADSSSDSRFSSDAVRKSRSSSFFSVPALFVGFTTKGSKDSDSARSPTSPLDYKVFSNLGNPFVRSPRSPGLDGPRKSWDYDRVGLGLVDSLNDLTKPCGKVLGLSESRNILFGSQMRSPKTRPDRLSDDASAASPKSLPKNYVISSRTRIGSPCPQLGSPETGLGYLGTQLAPEELGKIQSCLADIGRPSLPPLDRLMYRNQTNSNSEEFEFSSESKKSQLGSPPPLVRGVNFDKFSGSRPISLGASLGLAGSLSAGDLELSEDYTCVISHGPNPTTTHIFGDCILGSHTSNNKPGDEGKGWSSWMVECSEESTTPSPSDDFLSFCYSCKGKLEDGKDIYMYRGEKAFCSCGCRTREILVEEEEMEKPAIDSSDSPRSTCYEEIFLAGMVVAS